MRRRGSIRRTFTRCAKCSCRNISSSRMWDDDSVMTPCSCRNVSSWRIWGDDCVMTDKSMETWREWKTDGFVSGHGSGFFSRFSKEPSGVERWAPRTQISDAPREAAVHRGNGKTESRRGSPDNISRCTHPSKIAKGGAASVINGAGKNQRWASPLPAQSCSIAQNPLPMRSWYPPFAKCAKDWAPTVVAMPAKSKAWATRPLRF